MEKRLRERNKGDNKNGKKGEKGNGYKKIKEGISRVILAGIRGIGG